MRAILTVMLGQKSYLDSGRYQLHATSTLIKRVSPIDCMCSLRPPCYTMRFVQGSASSMLRFCAKICGFILLGTRLIQYLCSLPYCNVDKAMLLYYSCLASLGLSVVYTCVFPYLTFFFFITFLTTLGDECFFLTPAL